MNTSSRPYLVFLAAPALLYACAGSLDDPKRFETGMMMMTQTCAANLNVETDIFAMRCQSAACHETDMSASRLDLLSPGVKRRVLNLRSNSCPSRTIVTKSAPDMSVLLDRLAATAACGSRMPLTGAPLTTEQIDCVKVWVNNLVLSSTTAMGM